MATKIKHSVWNLREYIRKINVVLCKLFFPGRLSKLSWNEAMAPWWATSLNWKGPPA
jgi:hypothetical protein